VKSILSALRIAIAAVVAVLTPLVRWFALRFRQKARIRSRDAEMLRHAVPRLPQRFAAAREEGELLDMLAAFAEEADLGFVEVIAGGAIAYRWSPQKGAPPFGEDTLEGSRLRDRVTARFPIGRDGRARAEVCFGWVSPDCEVSPQSDILLQVATDVLEASLSRLRSKLAPLSEAVVPELPARRTEEALARRIG
jgi:hypothetical protein